MLEVHSLSKYYKGKAVLKDVSFSVSPGEVMGIIGPNGAGKSTLLRIVSGIIDAEEGEVSIEKNKHSIDASGSWGYLPEERGLYPQMKVLEQLIHFAMLKGCPATIARNKVIELMKEWKMDQYLHVKAGELSKGNQQRIQFLSSILHDPSLIILDEPFSGLDPVQADWLKAQILTFRKQGKLVLYSSHRMDSVEALCDRVLVLHEGRRVAYGSTHELHVTNEEVWQVNLRGGNENWHTLVKLLRKEQQSGERERIKFSLNGASLASVIAAIEDSGALLEEIKRDKPSLHELFIHLTSSNHVA